MNLLENTYRRRGVDRQRRRSCGDGKENSCLYFDLRLCFDEGTDDVHMGISVADMTRMGGESCTQEA